MARRRRRRPGESVEGEDSLLEDDDDDIDIRVTSIEEELQNLLLSTQESVRDQRAVRAKLDKLAREFEEDTEGDDELFQELDGLKNQTTTQLDQLSQAQHILTERVAELSERLSNVGGVGALEVLPARLEERVTQLHQIVQQRFLSQDTAREEEMDLVATRLEELTHNFEAQAIKVREALADQSKQDKLSADFHEGLSTLSDELHTTLADFSSKFRSSIAELTQQQQTSRQELEANLAELADAVDSRAGLEELSELKTELESLKASFSTQSELGQRAHQAVAKVEQLEVLLIQNSERYEHLLTRAKSLADETENYADQVDLAVRLVKALDDRGRGGTPADLTSPTPSVSIQESDLDAPEKTDLNFSLRDLLNVMSQNQASDLHIKVGSNPMVRLHGDLIPVGNNSLGEEDCRRLIFFALTKEERRRLLQQRSLDFTYEQSGLRLRGHAFYQRGRLCASLKMLRGHANIEELGLPTVLRRNLASLQHGMVLITGPLGSGKSTTLAALVDELNRTRKMHILSLESPIHMIHQDHQALITQREYGSDFTDTVRAIQEALKHDPDTLVIDPLPDAAATASALAAADSGHLVIAALDAPNSLSALERLLTLVDGASNTCDRRQLASSLKTIVSLRLLPRSDKSKGLVPAVEVLQTNQAVSQLLLDGNLEQLSQVVQKGMAGEGSQTMSQSLSRLLDAGMISESEASNLLPQGGSQVAPSDDTPLMRWL